MRGTRSAGYGFVALASNEAAEKAVELLDKKELDGRPVIVEIAKPSDQKDKEKKERRAKRRPGRRGGKAVPGEVTEAEANGEAAKPDAPAAAGTGDAAKPKKKKKASVCPICVPDLSISISHHPHSANLSPRPMERLRLLLLRLMPPQATPPRSLLVLASPGHLVHPALLARIPLASRPPPSSSSLISASTLTMLASLLCSQKQVLPSTQPASSADAGVSQGGARDMALSTSAVRPNRRRQSNSCLARKLVAVLLLSRLPSTPLVKMMRKPRKLPPLPVPLNDLPSLMLFCTLPCHFLLSSRYCYVIRFARQVHCPHVISFVLSNDGLVLFS